MTWLVISVVLIELLVLLFLGVALNEMHKDRERIEKLLVLLARIGCVPLDDDWFRPSNNPPDNRGHEKC